MTAVTTIGNFITDSLNRASNHALNIAPFAAIGYLGARIFTRIDPRAGLLCAGTAALARSLTFNYQGDRSNMQLNTAARIVGLVAAIFLPFYFCQKAGLDIGFKASLVFGAGLLAINKYTEVADTIKASICDIAEARL